MPLLPPGIESHRPAERGDLERLATEFAAIDAEAAERLVDSLVAQAIARWRLDDATFWQRVKFRARLIRAARRPTGGTDG